MPTVGDAGTTEDENAVGAPADADVDTPTPLIPAPAAGRTAGRIADWDTAAAALRQAALARLDAATPARVKDFLRGPVAVYTAAHTLLLLVSFAIFRNLHLGITHALANWDGVHYLDIADHGYENHLVYDADGDIQVMKIAWFPLYPMLMRWVGHALFIGSLDAGLLISAVAGLFAAVAIHRLVRDRFGDRVALITVALYATVPMALVQSALYTESLFLALATWALVFVVRRRWIPAGLLAGLGGATRPTALILIGIVGLACLIALIRERDWRALVGGMLAPLGYFAYYAYLRVHVGYWDAWSRAERAPVWNNHFDWGVGLTSFVKQVVMYDFYRSPYLHDFIMQVPLMVIGPFLLLYTLRERRWPWPVMLWVIGGVVFTFLAGGSNTSTGRYLMPYFPVLLVPVAGVLAKIRLSSLTVLIGFLACVGGWWGAFFFLNFPGNSPP